MISFFFSFSKQCEPKRKEKLKNISTFYNEPSRDCQAERRSRQQLLVEKTFPSKPAENNLM